MQTQRVATEEIKMKIRTTAWLFLSFSALSAYAAAINVNLGTADAFAVLAGSTVTNTGPTVVFGNLGVSAGSAITGFPPGIINGAMHDNDAVAGLAQNDLTTAYNFAAGETVTQDLTGQDLGGLTLLPGVYFFMSSAQLTGTLTLNNLGNPNAVFVFQIGSTLTTASNSSVVFINSGGDAGDSVFWQVGSSAALGTTTSFAGNILALTSITLNTGANITCGRALARNGAVTMDTNHVSIDREGCETVVGSVPEPGTATLLGAGLFLGFIVCRRGLRRA